METLRSRTRSHILPSIALLLLVGGYDDDARGQPRSAQTPPPAVTVVAIESARVPLTYEYAARVTASREVEVRAQASGILLRRNFVEGAAVKAGDILFEIDPRPYQAELAKTEAQLQQADAQLANASRDAERATRLAASGAGTTVARDDALSAKELAAASVAIAKAQVNMARLNLDYTTVRAPIDGITSEEQVPEGSLIGTTGDASLLTRITQRDPVYINFSATESEVSEVRSILEKQGLWQDANELIRVRVMFGDGRIYPLTATLDFTSSGLDVSTGTLQLRAVMPNPERRLLPGQFVRALVEGISLDQGIVVPHEAVMQGPQGQFVYTVNSQDNAEIRPIDIGREVRSGWVVKSGLKPGDRLITEGIIKVRPGAPVAISGDGGKDSQP